MSDLVGNPENQFSRVEAQSTHNQSIIIWAFSCKNLSLEFATSCNTNWPVHSRKNLSYSIAKVVQS